MTDDAPPALADELRALAAQERLAARREGWKATSAIENGPGLRDYDDWRIQVWADAEVATHRARTALALEAAADTLDEALSLLAIACQMIPADELDWHGTVGEFLAAEWNRRAPALTDGLVAAGSFDGEGKPVKLAVVADADRLAALEAVTTAARELVSGAMWHPAGDVTVVSGDLHALHATLCRLDAVPRAPADEAGHAGEGDTPND